MLELAIFKDKLQQEMKRKTTKFIGLTLLLLFVTSLTISCARKGACGSTKRGSKKKWKAFEKGF